MSSFRKRFGAASPPAAREKRIERFIHCNTCATRAGEGKYEQALEVGWTGTGSIQVWCRACNQEVINLVPPKPRAAGELN